MATLTVRSTPIEGGTGDLTTSSAAGGGDVFPNDGQTFFFVSNGSGGQITVTFTTAQTVDGLDIEDPAFTIENGGFGIFGPFPTKRFNNSSGQVAVAYSGVTSVVVAAFK